MRVATVLKRLLGLCRAAVVCLWELVPPTARRCTAPGTTSAGCSSPTPYERAAAAHRPGHRDSNLTHRYKAAYPEAIQAHLAVLARRRSLRPSEEYPVPTDEEWQKSLGHFERRTVSIGTCARAFSTPCIHDHARVRWPMLWPDPKQRSRLVEIRDNLTARVGEAERDDWSGEVEELQISFAGAENKLARSTVGGPRASLNRCDPGPATHNRLPGDRFLSS